MCAKSIQSTNEIGDRIPETPRVH